jgi:hypothetical protein
MELVIKRGERTKLLGGSDFSSEFSQHNHSYGSKRDHTEELQ